MTLMAGMDPHPASRATTIRRLLLRACLLAALGLGCVGAQAGEARVAVATNFLKAMRALAQDFAVETGHRAVVSGGSTGKLYAQVVAGAPFDALLAADAATPRRLVDEGHGVAGSQFTYAVGRLVLWSAEPGRVDPEGAVLSSDRYRRLAIANPRLAPYGAAAREVLEARGLLEFVAPRLVTGENIGQAYQFVATGNAEIGFVALSQVMGEGREAAGSRWRVPPELHGEIRQDAVLLARGRDNEAARALLDWLRTPAARKRIRGFGYETAGTATESAR